MSKGIEMGRGPLPIPQLLKREGKENERGPFSKRLQNGPGLFSKRLENSPRPFSKP